MYSEITDQDQLEELLSALRNDRYSTDRAGKPASRWADFLDRQWSFLIPAKDDGDPVPEIKTPSLATFLAAGLESTWATLELWSKDKKATVAHNDEIDLLAAASHIRGAAPNGSAATAMVVVAARDQQHRRTADWSSQPRAPRYAPEPRFPAAARAADGVRKAADPRQATTGTGFRSESLDTTSPLAFCTNCEGRHPGGVKGCRLFCGLHDKTSAPRHLAHHCRCQRTDSTVTTRVIDKLGRKAVTAYAKNRDPNARRRPSRPAAHAAVATAHTRPFVACAFASTSAFTQHGSTPPSGGFFTGSYASCTTPLPSGLNAATSAANTELNAANKAANTDAAKNAANAANKAANADNIADNTNADNTTELNAAHTAANTMPLLGGLTPAAISTANTSYSSAPPRSPSSSWTTPLLGGLTPAAISTANAATSTANAGYNSAPPSSLTSNYDAVVR